MENLVVIGNRVFHVTIDENIKNDILNYLKKYSLEDKFVRVKNCFNEKDKINFTTKEILNNIKTSYNEIVDYTSEIVKCYSWDIYNNDVNVIVSANVKEMPILYKILSCNYPFQVLLDYMNGDVLPFDFISRANSQAITVAKNEYGKSYYIYDSNIDMDIKKEIIKKYISNLNYNLIDGCKVKRNNFLYTIFSRDDIVNSIIIKEARDNTKSINELNKLVSSEKEKFIGKKKRLIKK